MIDIGPSSEPDRLRIKTRNILSKLFGVGGGFGLINWSAQVDDEPKGKKEKEAKVGCVESFFVRTLGIVSVLFLAKEIVEMESRWRLWEISQKKRTALQYL